MGLDGIRRQINLIYPLSKGERLTIIAGMPKSGTTAIAKLLGAAAGLRVCNDPFHQMDKRKIEFREALFSGRLSLARLWQEQRHIFKGGIVKDPNFPILLPQLRELFPKAKVVFIVRDPRDNIRSILNRLRMPGNPQEGSFMLPSLSVGWYNVLCGKSPDMPGNDYLEHMAWRWRRSAEQYLQCRASVWPIRYEDFNADRKQAIESLARELGLSVVGDISQLVNIQFQPKGTMVKNWKAFYGVDNLERINAIVDPLLYEFGYDQASKLAGSDY